MICFDFFFWTAEFNKHIHFVAMTKDESRSSRVKFRSGIGMGWDTNIIGSGWDRMISLWDRGWDFNPSVWDVGWDVVNFGM